MEKPSVVWSFVIVAMMSLVVIAITSSLGWRWWWRILAGIGVTAAVVIPLYFLFEPRVLGDQSALGQLRSSPYRELALLALLLLGMVARVLSVAIERRNKSGGAQGIDFDKWEFVYPMLFAIPTFAGLLSQIQTERLTLADTALAFQTGFFWQTILKKAGPK